MRASRSRSARRFVALLLRVVRVVGVGRAGGLGPAAAPAGAAVPPGPRGRRVRGGSAGVARRGRPRDRGGRRRERARRSRPVSGRLRAVLAGRAPAHLRGARGRNAVRDRPRTGRRAARVGAAPSLPHARVVSDPRPRARPRGAPPRRLRRDAARARPAVPPRAASVARTRPAPRPVAGEARMGKRVLRREEGRRGGGGRTGRSVRRCAARSARPGDRHERSRPGVRAGPGTRAGRREDFFE